VWDGNANKKRLQKLKELLKLEDRVRDGVENSRPEAWARTAPSRLGQRQRVPCPGQLPGPASLGQPRPASASLGQLAWRGDLVGRGWHPGQKGLAFHVR